MVQAWNVSCNRQLPFTNETNPKNPDRYPKSIKPIKLRESRIMLEVAGFDMEFMGFLPFPVLSQVQAASATRNWVGI
jgi:hypothetical protein